MCVPVEKAATHYYVLISVKCISITYYCHIVGASVPLYDCRLISRISALMIFYFVAVAVAFRDCSRRQQRQSDETKAQHCLCTHMHLLLGVAIVAVHYYHFAYCFLDIVCRWHSFDLLRACTKAVIPFSFFSPSCFPHHIFFLSLFLLSSVLGWWCF